MKDGPPEALQPSFGAPGSLPTLPPSIRSRAALGLTAAAAAGRFELQVCRNCGAVQYPPRDACHRCLSSVLDWRLQSGGAELLSETTLRHSHDEFFRGRLPIRLGLVRLDSGPTAVVYLDDGVGAAPGRVRVGVRLDKAGQGVLVAVPDERVMRAGEGGMTADGLSQSKHLREMSCDPRGRKVLVSDAGSALGVALVRELVEAGVEVVWAGCSPAVAARGGLGGLPGGLDQVRVVRLDATSDESVDALAAQVGSQVDVLINNAEAHSSASGAGVGSARVEMETNYFGLLRLARAFGPAMRARAAGAPVGSPTMAWVNLLSIHALSSLPAQGTFSASKAAAYSFSQALRAEMLPAGIRVLNVFPGLVDDERSREMAAVNLARAVVRALLDGVEDLYPDEMAQDVFARWNNNPKMLEREIAADR